ncbi:MAG: NIP7 pre-PUA domain-containing protein [Candidatus Heimdallarchaeota archaeon]
MVIEFREPTKTEGEIIRNSLLYWVDNEKLQLFNEKYHFIIGDGNWKEVFITNKATSTFVTNEKRVSPYSIGLGIGEIKNKNLLLTLSGGYFISPHTDKKAIITLEAEQLFLYMRDIYCKSVISIKEGLSKGDKVLVVNTSTDYLGLGKILLPISDFGDPKKRDEVALKNIMDLGWYLRKGK